ncbi:c-type cytochrome biogenesis protein CcmI [Rhodobacter capsulatus]|uniref:c-type cytochrome biogenesis protein CcmI n=1 Tax=Rhodobacter capsulatus TaxID=1061 RepID=UPI00402544EF
MLFWIICATLVAAIAFALALTLLRPRGQGLPAGAQDLQVYRAQLAEVEKDLARGVLSPEEAARSRVEISRRLLEADRALQAAGTAAAEAPRRGTVAAAALVVAALAGLSRSTTGSARPVCPMRRWPGGWPRRRRFIRPARIRPRRKRRPRPSARPPRRRRRRRATRCRSPIRNSSS